MSTSSHQQPVIFEEFFELGQQETASPFLTPQSRHFGALLTLKASIVAAVLLCLSFALSFDSGWEPISKILLIGVYFLAGIPALIESIEDLVNLEVNIDILMTLAAFSSIFIGSGMEGALLLVLFALSGSMEDAVTTKAKGAISSLRKLSPTRACVIKEDGTLVERAVGEVSVNAAILIKAGEIIPLDGIVTEGTSSVNLVHITGENFPVTKTVGDEVPAGARNLEGALTLSVSHTSSDSTLAKIIQLVTQAQEARPQLQRWFDGLSQGYAITIILLAGIFTAVFPFLFGIPLFGVEGSLYRALAFLIAASPCALIIAIPIAYLSAVSACARKGILLKGGITLDALASCKTMAFDKTGTLTTGDLKCLEVEPLFPAEKGSIEKAISVAYSMERNAVHPIAKALLAYGEEHKASILPITAFRSIPGYGLEGEIEEGKVFIGHPEYIFPHLASQVTQPLEEKVQEIRDRGELVAVLQCGENFFLFRFRDQLRPDIRPTLETLKQKWNLKILMLTGDHAVSAKRIADELNVDAYFADLRPEDKLTFVSEIAQKENLAMVGDGVNDAPALARATVGISMGKGGSTAAIDASDVVLLQDRVPLISWLMAKAIKTQRIVKQNLIIATSAIVLASIPALAGWVPLWLAVVLHEGGTVLVGLNALRLLRK